MPIYFHYRDSLQKKSPKNKTKILPKKTQLVYCLDVLPGNLIVVAVSKNPAP